MILNIFSYNYESYIFLLLKHLAHLVCPFLIRIIWFLTFNFLKLFICSVWYSWQRFSPCLYVFSPLCTSPIIYSVTVCHFTAKCSGKMMRQRLLVIFLTALHSNLPGISLEGDTSQLLHGVSSSCFSSLFSWLL